MKRRTKWLLISAGSLAGMALCFMWAAPREPQYQGRALSQWVADLSYPNSQTQQMAQAAIREIGPEAVPYLTNSLAQRSALSVRIYRKNILPRKLVDFTKKIVKWQSPVVQSRSAALALQVMGPQATNAIPELIAALQDPSVMVVHHAIGALGAMGTNAVPPLRERIRYGQFPEIQYVLQATAFLGTNAASLAPEIIDFLGHTNSGVRSMAAYAMARSGPDAAVIVTNVFTGTNFVAQAYGITVLNYLGRIDFATNYLHAMSESPDLEVRRAATNTLRQFGGRAKN